MAFNILAKIIKHKREELGKLPSSFKAGVFKKASLLKKLTESSINNKPLLIAEAKKASPSKGVIVQDFNPVEIANSYAKAGASCISVLTDEQFFLGNTSYLTEVKRAMEPFGIPVLRKDFIIDAKQIHQSKAIGADVILLIAKILPEAKLKEFYNLAQELGLEVLLEVHTKKEFWVAQKLGAKIIGVNNRNLNTFKVSLNATLRIIEEEDTSDMFIISESGIQSFHDIAYLHKKGVSGFLVGESLLVEDDIEKAVKSILGA